MEISPAIAGHFAYLLILASIGVPVLIISLYRPIRNLRNVRPLLFSIMVVDPFYIVWDELAVKYGSWSFNGKYIIGIHIWLIPLEEIIFFLVVPFATILIYEGIGLLRLSSLNLPGWPFALIAAVFLIFALLNFHHSYTVVSFAFAGLVILISLCIKPDLLASKRVWVYMIISYIPFIIFDHMMVTLPVFTYGRGSIMGIRIFSIPVEEYVYVFSLLLAYILSYRFYSDRYPTDSSVEMNAL